MGIGTSTCKGLIHPQPDDGDEANRSLSTVTRLPFLPVFEDRPPFEPVVALCEKDSSLLKALTHHRTPFAVIETATEDLKIVYASGGWVAGMGMPVESIEGTGFASVLKKGIKASQADIDRLDSSVRAQQVSAQPPLVCAACSKHIHTRCGFSLPKTTFILFVSCECVLCFNVFRQTCFSPRNVTNLFDSRLWTCMVLALECTPAFTLTRWSCVRGFIGQLTSSCRHTVWGRNHV